MKKEEVFQELQDIIVDKIGLDYEEIEMDSDFTNDLGCDSLDFVELIMEVEKNFNIYIPDDEIEHVRSVGHAVDFIHSKINS